jgi:transcriptional regulator with XRE-family HTH domain
MEQETLHDYVIRKLQDTKGRWPEVAEGAGISRRTLEKIARRETRDPSVSLVEKLARYFRNLPA